MTIAGNKPLVLAGDIGGTKTNIGLFYSGRKGPRLKTMEQFSSPASPDLETIIQRFLQKHPARIAAACFGIAGPVVNGRCKTTNLPWNVSERRLKNRFGWPRVRLINDLIATALAVAVLPARDFLPLNAAKPRKGRPVGLIAPGTGLGQAFLVFHNGRTVSVASEGDTPTSAHIRTRRSNCGSIFTGKSDMSAWKAFCPVPAWSTSTGGSVIPAGIVNPAGWRKRCAKPILPGRLPLPRWIATIRSVRRHLTGSFPFSELPAETWP